MTVMEDDINRSNVERGNYVDGNGHLGGISVVNRTPC